MTVEIITRIVELIVLVLFGAITRYVIPYVKEQLGSDKYNRLVDYCSIAVRAAEQLFDEEQWQLKKQYVTACVKEFCKNTLHIELEEADIDTIVEGCVNLVKKGRVVSNGK